MTTQQKKLMSPPQVLGTPYILYLEGSKHPGCRIQCCEYRLRRSPKHPRTLCIRHYNTVIGGILRHRKYRGRTRAFWEDLRWKPYREGFTNDSNPQVRAYYHSLVLEDNARYERRRRRRGFF